MGAVPERTPEEIEKLLRQQEQSAQLLVRRDLELSRANERLHALDEQKSKFISVAAHQLRTPLSAIRWSLGYVLSGRAGAISEEQATLLRQSQDSTIRLVKLVNDLLGVDRLESGRVAYNFVPVDLHDAVQSVLTDLAPEASRRRVALVFHNKLSATMLALADVQQLRLVIQNLLENAVKYTPAGGTITVMLEEAGSELRVSVSDTGIGIPADQQEQVFKQFFRARNAVKMETDGSGLGLYLVQETVSHMGGKVSFMSEEGKGTSFSFTLPKTPSP